MLPVPLVGRVVSSQITFCLGLFYLGIILKLPCQLSSLRLQKFVKFSCASISRLNLQVHQQSNQTLSCSVHTFPC